MAATDPSPASSHGTSLADYYTREARTYRELWAPRLRQYTSELLPSLPLEGAHRVLDIGAGVGTLLHDLADAAPRAVVVGVELSEGMLRLADARFGRAVMDANALGLAGDSVDVATTCFMLFHLPDPLTALREARRVLRPGGSLGVITWGEDPDSPALKAWNDELDRHGAAADPQTPHHDLVNTSAKMADLLHAANFEQTRSWTAEMRETVDVERFVDTHTHLGRSRRRLGTLDPATREACLRDAVPRLRRMDPDDLTETSTVVYTTARKPG